MPALQPVPYQESVMTIQCSKLAGATLTAALALATTAALAADVTLYQRPNFGGTAVTVHTQSQDLQSTAFNDTATSMVIRDGVWQACTEANFQGRCVQLQPGAYANLNASLNGSVASVREISTVAATPPATLVAATPPRVVIAAAPPRVVLFENRNFGGRSIELNASAGDLDRMSNYNNASAAIVYTGTWRLCSEEHSRGDCSDFAPGRYENLGLLNGRIRSAELVAPGTPIAALPAEGEIGRVIRDENTNEPVIPDRTIPRGYTAAQ